MKMVVYKQITLTDNFMDLEFWAEKNLEYHLIRYLCRKIRIHFFQCFPIHRQSLEKAKSYF